MAIHGVCVQDFMHKLICAMYEARVTGGHVMYAALCTCGEEPFTRGYVTGRCQLCPPTCDQASTRFNMLITLLHGAIFRPLSSSCYRSLMHGMHGRLNWSGL